MDKTLLINYVNENMSISQISKIENKSKTSIRYWLNKYNLKTCHESFKNGYTSEKSLQKINGIPIQNCSECNVSLTEETGYFRKSKNIWQSKCKQCHNKYTADRWKQSKLRAVEYKGGKCEKCNYDKCIDALEFHHIDPSIKDKNFGNLKLRKWEDQQKELDKCILVCANCHREIHSNLRSISKN